MKYIILILILQLLSMLECSGQVLMVPVNCKMLSPLSPAFLYLSQLKHHWSSPLYPPFNPTQFLQSIPVPTHFYSPCSLEWLFGYLITTIFILSFCNSFWSFSSSLLTVWSHVAPLQQEFALSYSLHSYFKPLLSPSIKLTPSTGFVILETASQPYYSQWHENATLYMYSVWH